MGEEMGMGGEEDGMRGRERKAREKGMGEWGRGREKEEE